MNEYDYVVRAGGNYGGSHAFYRLEDGKLRLVASDHWGSAVGSRKAETFGGLTVEEAREKVARLNERPDHKYDGCQLCTYGASIRSYSEEMHSIADHEARMERLSELQKAIPR